MAKNPAEVPLLHRSFWEVREELAYQRATTKEWKAMLLAERDRPIIRGHLRQIVAKQLGAGIVELRLKPMKEAEPKKGGMKFIPPKYDDINPMIGYQASFIKKLREFIDGIGKEKRQAIVDEFRAGGINIGSLVKKYDSDTLVISTIITDNIEIHSHATIRKDVK